jgi:hypothetical protein
MVLDFMQKHAFQNKYGAIFMWKNGIFFYNCWDIWLVPWEMFDKVQNASCVVLIDNFLKGVVTLLAFTTLTYGFQLMPRCSYIKPNAWTCKP